MPCDSTRMTTRNRPYSFGWEKVSARATHMNSFGHFPVLTYSISFLTRYGPMRLKIVVKMFRKTSQATSFQNVNARHLNRALWSV